MLKQCDYCGTEFDGRPNRRFCNDNCKKQEKRRIRDYGLTGKQIRGFAASQDGKCYICSKVCALVVDHNHVTKQVRKLLCSNCNVALGLLKEDPALFQKCIDYIKEFSV